MSESASSFFSVSHMYMMAQRMHSAIPYNFLKNGYAFPPFHYYIEMTRRCNLRCKMCQYIEWLENTPISVQREGELETDEWHRVVDQITKFSLTTFTGGEPFVRKDFLEVLEHASRRSRTHFISNTTMMPEDRAEALVNLAPKRLGGLGFNFAGTSIEGPGDRHDEIRRLKGAFERSMRGVQAIVQLRDKAGKQCPLVHITTVIQKDNVDDLKYMPEVIKKFGADVLNLVTESRMQELPDLGHVDPQIYNLEDVKWPYIDRKRLQRAIEETEEAATKHGIELRLPRMPIEEVYNYYDGTMNLKEYECRNAWTTLIIGYKGDVFPCWIRKIGNVKEHTLKEIWQNSVMRDFRKTCQKKLFAPCPGCCFIEYKGKAASKPAAANTQG